MGYAVEIPKANETNTATSTLAGPLELQDRIKDDGEVYFNVVDGNERPVLYVHETHEAAAREIVRLANLGLAQ